MFCLTRWPRLQQFPVIERQIENRSGLSRYELLLFRVEEQTHEVSEERGDVGDTGFLRNEIDEGRDVVGKFLRRFGNGYGYVDFRQSCYLVNSLAKIAHGSFAFLNTQSKPRSSGN